MSDISRKIFDLTFALFRVTDRFPSSAAGEKEFLRNQAYRLLKKVISFEVGNKNFNSAGSNEIQTLVHVLVEKFRRIRPRPLLNPLNFEVLEREYLKFSGDLAEYKEKLEAADSQPLDFRKRQILDHLQKSGPAGTHDFISLFEEAPSVKTIQRDLNSLLASRAIIRLGNRRWSRYTANPVRTQPLSTMINVGNDYIPQTIATKVPKVLLLP